MLIRRSLMIAALIGMLTTGFAFAEESDPVEPVAGKGEEIGAAIDTYADAPRLEETVVTVTRVKRPTFELPRSTTVIPKETIQEGNPVHIIDVITKRDAGIIMDIRTNTTGDPIMRGFAGFNLLTLIDMNSLSTLWGEGGFGADDMYSKIDPETIETIEIVHGPSSVLYGSNALGGVINFITRSSPIDYQDDGYDWGGRAKGTYFSNSNGWRLRFEGFGATTDLKYLIGLSTGSYGNGEGGRGLGTLDPTGGKETDFDIRFDWMADDGNELTLSVLRVYRDPAYKFFRPTQVNTADRWGVALTWNCEEALGFMKPFEWRVYYQYKRDTRTWDDGREGYAQTDTWSTDLQASSDLGSGHFLTYGLHGHVDIGESADDEQFTFVKPPPKRADAPNTEWWNFAGFVQDEWKAIPDVLDLTASLRYDFFMFESLPTDEYVPPVGDPELDFYEDSIGAFTGGLGATVTLSEEWRLLASYSRGFRQYAPNFGIRQIGAGVLIPNELLDPVTSNNFELGVRTRNSWIFAEVFGYYSDIGNWQAIRPDTFEGSDWFDYNGNGVRDTNEDVVSQQSVDDAYIYGFEAKTTIWLPQAIDGFPAGWSVWGSFAVNYGKVADGDYMRHTQPARGLIGFRWDDADPKRQAYFELITEMSGSYDRIPASRVESDLAWRRDPQDGGSPLLRSYGGVPGYTVFHIYAGLNLCENARVTLGIENLTNKKYRLAHSRMDAFGTNVVLGLDLSF